jgi:hypothetical protein
MRGGYDRSREFYVISNQSLQEHKVHNEWTLQGQFIENKQLQDSVESRDTPFIAAW